jgi:hypothetical protein
MVVRRRASDPSEEQWHKNADFPVPNAGPNFTSKPKSLACPFPASSAENFIMPHFRLDVEHLTMGVSLGGDGTGNTEMVLGRLSGWSTPQEREKVAKANAIYLIERWEEVRAFPYSPPDDIKKAANAAMSAIWPKRTFIHNGKKYTRISNSKRQELVVTEIEPKRVEKSPEDAGGFKIY